MAMVPADLKDAIKTAMDSEKPDNAIDAQKVFGDELSKYLIENCEIEYAWVGADPVPSPDPVTSFIATPTWITFPLLPVPSFELWFVSLSTLIQTAILEPETSVPPFLLTPLTFGIVPMVGVQSGLTDPDDAMLDVCEQIIDGIKLMINPIPATGTHGSYIGTASMISIS